MSDLAARIRAQLDETERIARGVEFPEWYFDHLDDAKRDWEEQITAAWVLATVAAHRQILDLHSSDGGHECAGGKDVWGNVTVFERDCPTVLALAAACGIDTQEQR